MKDAISVKEFDEFIRLTQVRDNLYNSKAYRVRKEYRLSRNAYRIFKDNYIELKKIIRKHNNYLLHELLSSKYGKKRLSDLHNEASRCLHNYLASIQTIIDTSRVSKNWLRKEDQVEYQAKIDDTFKSNSNFQFVKDLRNITQHEKIPQVLSRTSSRKLDSDELQVKTSLFITSNYILDSEMKKSSREILDNHPKGVPIEDFIDESYQLISDFQTWLDNKIRQNISSELKEVNRLERKWKASSMTYSLDQFISKQKLSRQDLESQIFGFCSTYYAGKINSTDNDSDRLNQILSYLNHIGVDIEKYKRMLDNLYR